MSRYMAPPSHLKVCRDCAATLGSRQAGTEVMRMVRDAVAEEARRVNPTLHHLVQRKAEAYDIELSPIWVGVVAASAAYEFMTLRYRAACERGEAVLDTSGFLRFAESRIVKLLSKAVIEYAICVDDRRILGRVPLLIDRARGQLEAQGIHADGKLIGACICNIVRGSYDDIVDAFEQAVAQFDPKSKDVPPTLALEIMQVLERAVQHPSLTPVESGSRVARGLADVPQWLNPVVFKAGVEPMCRSALIMTGRSFITLEAIKRVQTVFSTAHSRHLAVARVVLQLSYEEVAASNARLEKHRAGAEVARKELSQAMRRIRPALESLARINPHVCQFAVQRDLFEIAFETGIQR